MITYNNGNYRVILKEDGTKIHLLPDNEDEYKPNRIETLDICISTYCKNGCEFCYENCSADGTMADLDSKEVINVINSIPYGTEIAINLNSFTWKYIPMLERFLMLCKVKHLIVNVTIRQNDFMLTAYQHLISNWKSKGFIYGIGVSLIKADDNFIREIKKEKWNNNIVIHTINGITKWEDYEKLVGCKVLILGYKNIGRGEKYLPNIPESKTLHNNIGKLSEITDVLSFDNLAIEQLQIKDMVSEEVWEHSYMGDEGTISMFIDLVNLTYAKSSLTPKENRMPMIKTIQEMYNDIRKD